MAAPAVSVYDRITKKTREYPSIALCAMDIRTTYPSLCYRLSVNASITVNGRYTVKPIGTSKRHNALTVQVRNTRTDKLHYFETIRACAAFLDVEEGTLSRHLGRKRNRFSMGNYIVYRIG